MFSKNIDCSEELDGKILHLYSNKNRIINVGANIIVPEGYFCVFACRDKVTDVILPGKYAINGANLPKTFSRMKLGKPNKNGKYKKKFEADIYYINNSINSNMKFVAYNAFKIKSEKAGKIKALSEGLFDFQIMAPDVMLKYFISERPYIEEELFLDILGGLIGNYVNGRISENKEDIVTQLASPNEYFNGRINDQVKLDAYFEDFGIRVSDIRVEVLHTNTKNDLVELIENEKKKQKSESINFDFNVPIMVEKKSVSSARVCKHCGHKLSGESMFCEKCGNLINNLN